MSNYLHDNNGERKGRGKGLRNQGSLMSLKQKLFPFLDYLSSSTSIFSLFNPSATFSFLIPSLPPIRTSQVGNPKEN
jgi:hypothetical protein